MKRCLAIQKNLKLCLTKIPFGRAIAVHSDNQNGCTSGQWIFILTRISFVFQIVEFESPSMLSIDPDSQFSKLLQAADLQKAQDATERVRSIQQKEQNLNVKDDTEDHTNAERASKDKANTNIGEQDLQSNDNPEQDLPAKDDTAQGNTNPAFDEAGDTKF